MSIAEKSPEQRAQEARELREARERSDEARAHAFGRPSTTLANGSTVAGALVSEGMTRELAERTARRWETGRYFDLLDAAESLFAFQADGDVEVRGLMPSGGTSTLKKMCRRASEAPAVKESALMKARLTDEDWQKVAEARK